MQFHTVADHIRAVEDESFPARHPGADRAVLACRCGTVLDARDMVRIRTPRAGFDHVTSTAIYPIGCYRCAVRAGGVYQRPPRSWHE